MTQINQKYLTFLRIDSTPSKCRIQKERNRIRQERKHINGNNETFIRWDVEKFVNDELKRFVPLPRIYSVPIYELEQKAKHKNIGNLIDCVRPTITMCDSDYRARVEFFKKTQIQVNCGAYYDITSLFLLDDIVEWGYNQLEWDQIRTAEDIILAMRADKEMRESEAFIPRPGSHWLVEVECRSNVIAVCNSGQGFYIPGQEPCWAFSHVSRWIKEIVTE